jgi:hypothetical protein
MPRIWQPERPVRVRVLVRVPVRVLVRVLVRVPVLVQVPASPRRRTPRPGNR